MYRAKVTSKGQVTIPKKVRERMGVAEGEEVYFIEDKDGFRVKKAVRKSPFDDWVGYLRGKTSGLSSDEIVDALRGR
ncbi:MAG: AbrB/MazE/SpoVT family DNA-binding domain-containing protein [Candidatus Aminicenantes bacterium]|nr:AbrB/MazE/SpoVT family DNA-binding domain-containing protein [Candidatus Aminicenantes bacterium]